MSHNCDGVCGDGWRFECCDIFTGRVKALLHPTSVSWDDNLSEPGNFQLTAASRALAAADIWPHRTTLYISRLKPDGRTRNGMFAGIIETYGGTVSGTTTIAGPSIESYLNERNIANQLGGYAYSKTALQTVLAKQLVDMTHFNFVNPNVPVAFPPNTSIPLYGQAGTSAITKTFAFNAWEYKNIGEALRSLVESDDGLEYRLQHLYSSSSGGFFWETNMQFADEIGEVKETIVLKGDREGWEYGVTVDAKDHATWTYGIGDGEETAQLESIGYDPSGYYPYFHTVQPFKDAKSYSELDPLTKGWAAYHRDPIATPSMTIAGLDHPTPEEMLTGDTVSVDIKYGIITYDAPARVMGQGWSLETEAPAKRTLTFRPVIRPALTMLQHKPVNVLNPGTTPLPNTTPEPVAGLVTKFKDARIQESSSLAVSPFDPDIIYTSNDENESAHQIYIVRLSTGETIGTFSFSGQTFVDPEAIQIDKTGHLWLADNGDNNLSRGTIKVVKTNAPAPRTEGNHGAVACTAYVLDYPGTTKYNSEALAFRRDGSTGFRLLFTKGTGSSSKIFRLPTELNSGATNLLIAGKSNMPANISDATYANTHWILLRQQDVGYTSVIDVRTMTMVGKIPDPAKLLKGESIAMEWGGKSFLIGSEGKNAPIYRVVLPAKYRGAPGTVTTPNTPVPGTPSTGGSPGNTPRARYPADIFGKNWKVTLPINGAQEIEQPQLATFTKSPWFYLNAAKTGVIFRVNHNSATKGNSTNPRCELREMKNNGLSTYEWDGRRGKHSMEVRTRVLELGAPDHGVLAQIHGEDTPGHKDDVSVFRLEGNKLWITNGDETHGKLALSNYQLGDPLTLKFEVVGGRIYYYVNGNKINYALKIGNNNYFKTGAYLQKQSGGSSSDNLIVELSSVKVTHS